MIMARRRRKKIAVLHFKTSIFLAENTISALFQSQNPEKIPASGRISDYTPPPCWREGKNKGGGYNWRGGYNQGIPVWVDL